jgi:hypothetical protein
MKTMPGLASAALDPAAGVCEVDAAAAAGGGGGAPRSGDALERRSHADAASAKTSAKAHA